MSKPEPPPHMVAMEGVEIRANVKSADHAGFVQAMAQTTAYYASHPELEVLDITMTTKGDQMVLTTYCRQRAAEHPKPRADFITSLSDDATAGPSQG